MPLNQELLSGASTVTWSIEKPPTGAIPEFVYLGRDDANLGAIQVALASVSNPPSKETMRALHQARKGKSTIQLVVGAVMGDRIWIFGPDERTQVIESLPLDQGCRQLQSALDEPNALAAYTRLGQFRRSLDTTSLVGITNSGLFASYHIRENVPKRTDWDAACAKAKPWLNLRTDQLIKALGFKSEKTAGNALLLTSGTPQSKAVAILLDESEQFDSTSARHTGISPVAFGLNVAARQRVPWLFLLRKDQIRIYPAKDGIGVGQKGQVETYFEIDLAAIDSERAGLLTLIFSADALEPNGTAHELLEGSQRFASQLGLRLRERIYEHVVPQLSKSVAEHLRDQGTKLDSEGLNLAYRLTLRILFRLLFQAYAEDRGLLPAGRNEGYDANSLKTIAKRIIDTPAEQFGKSKTLWFDLVQVWDAIDEGNETWNVPAYNGGLFGTDPEIHAEGAQIEKLGIQDDILGPVLQHLLIDISEDNVPGPVDFRSLSVREFGTIYEGLLESSLSVATQDLTVDSKGAWIPASKSDQVIAATSDVYFHSASGERKATGSFFTPSVVVDHVIDRSLDPALDAHLGRIKKHLAAGDEASAARDFFDFRVADLAMGSGHFLVAAVDRIEAKMRTFLAEKDTQVPGINAELHRLAHAAKSALGKDESAIGEIEPSALLRRQIARRCIYGLDINPLAVELSRLAIWIHTFVPGLPMSSLDHGLVCANSLTGIGTIEEALQALQPDIPVVPLKKGHARLVSVYESVITENLEKASKLLIEVANSDEAKKSEVKAAALIAQKARKSAEPTREIFNAAVAARLGLFDPRNIFDENSLIEMSKRHDVDESIALLNPAHFPYLFPEVFLRENPGFDVLLGNPPWEEPIVAEHKFWNRFFPGLVSEPNAKQKSLMAEYATNRPDLVELLNLDKETNNVIRESLVKGPFPGMGAGDPDLYKGFAWRNWSLLRGEGLFGGIFPRSLWVTKGSAEWRRRVIPNSVINVDFCRNRGEWMFEGVNPGLQITLVTVQKESGPELMVSGEYDGLEVFNSQKDASGVAIPIEKLAETDAEFCIPAIDSIQAIQLWTLLLNFPALSDGRLPNHRSDFRCSPANDLHATNDSNLFVDDVNAHQVTNHRNISQFQFDAGVDPFAYCDLLPVEKYLQSQRVNTVGRPSSPFSIRSNNWALDASTHPLKHARLALRGPVHSSNTRKVWCALLPENTVTTNNVTTLVFDSDDKILQSYVMGVLNSGVIDWYGHLKINLYLNFFILYTLPVPVYVQENPICMRIAELARRLAIVPGLKYGNWGKGINPIITPRERESAIAEIDALLWEYMALPEKFLSLVFDGRATRSALADVNSFLVKGSNKS
jgi:hypothetical protein